MAQWENPYRIICSLFNDMSNNWRVVFLGRVFCTIYLPEATDLSCTLMVYVFSFLHATRPYSIFRQLLIKGGAGVPFGTVV